MPFEFDLAKSASNKIKHGIDFVEAQVIWLDQKRVETTMPTASEQRFQMLGLIGEKLWSAIFTHRGEKIRLISVRRVRKDEKERYHGR